MVALLCVVTVYVLCLILTVLWIGLQSVILAVPGHSHLLFGIACDMQCQKVSDDDQEMSHMQCQKVSDDDQEMPFVNILRA